MNSRLALTIVVGFASWPSFAWAGSPAASPTPLLGADASTIAVPVAATFKDGTYSGPSINAYWGDVQVQVVVQSGQISAVSMVRYPSDRRESLRINQAAFPLLRNEVMKAQNARVNVITGATLTSQAFIRSLDAALAQAAGLPPPTTGQPPAGPGVRPTPGQNTIGI